MLSPPAHMLLCYVVATHNLMSQHMFTPRTVVLMARIHARYPPQRARGYASAREFSAAKMAFERQQDESPYCRVAMASCEEPRDSGASTHARECRRLAKIVAAWQTAAYLPEICAVGSGRQQADARISRDAFARGSSSSRARAMRKGGMRVWRWRAAGRDARR